MAAILEWYYATSDGRLCLSYGGESVWATSPVGLQTAPAVTEGVGKVWSGTENGNLITFDAVSGDIVRSVSLGGSVFYTGCHGPNLIVALADGQVFAIDPASEGVRWRSQVEGKVLSAVETNNVLTLLPLEGPATVAVDSAGGATLWTTPYEGSFAAADDGIVYIASYARTLEARRASSGAVLWSLADLPANVSGLNAFLGVLYAGTESQTVEAFTGTTGAAQWSSGVAGFPGTPMPAQAEPGEPGGASLIVAFGNTGAAPSPGLAGYNATTGEELWVIGSLGADVGEQPSFPLTRLYRGCVGLPLEGLVYFYNLLGQQTPERPAPWNVGQQLAGLGYLHGEVPAWPRP
jgi:hypothetical protein